MDNTCENSAAELRERGAIAALKALPLRTLVAGDAELMEGSEVECALCLLDLVAGDVMRVLPCRQYVAQSLTPHETLHACPLLTLPSRPLHSSSQT